MSLPDASPPKADPSAPPTRRQSQAAVQQALEAVRAGELTVADVDLSDQNLIGADFSGLDLMGLCLAGCDLSRANFEQANLMGADLSGATLFEARLDGAELAGANLQGANLEGARLVGTGLGKANLKHARLGRAEATGATFTGSDLSSADLRGCSLTNARARAVKLRHTELGHSDLAGIDLEDSDVHHARFDNASLRGASLSGLRGYGQASWIGVDMRDVNFTGAYLCRRVVMDQNFLHEFRRQSAWNRVVYEVWRWTSACGQSALRWTLCTLVIMLLFAWVYGMVEVDFGEYATPLSPLYFSVVTLTTLGFGDVLPVTVGAQLVTMLEVLTGYVMLGGLLSIFSNKMASRAN